MLKTCGCPPYQGGIKGGSAPPYQGGIKGESNPKSILNLIITSYLDNLTQLKNRVFGELIP
ncbi:MAG: hypothetical protein EWV50_17795 [Microcystis aeruginosa Ma_MB_F_20061100_S20]|uniref:Uncharacterized protein n=1 Tax=Microcystis aeruginosa Ma_MB_F_20061100_S20D TaxID=2486253 RepID=A0A552EZQ1_MICAE|nr:MAG: hypothetical protein EWV50_17795 [Microcystis aeruginosa Ma_MB_F_20061100_S20]TRU39941.1 MAG: hypothetical protein EWV78_02120 [Microcystis aeruginosa Ma_MB_F_20061100_S20D]